MIARKMQVQTDTSITGTILTIFFSLISVQDIDIAAKILAMTGTAITMGFTCVHTYYKIKRLKNEKDTTKH